MYFDSTTVQQRMWIFKEERLFMMQVKGFAFSPNSSMKSRFNVMILRYA